MTTQSGIVLPSFFASGMVLQRGVNHPLWGSAPAGTAISVDFMGKRYEAVASPDGRWLVTLEPLSPGGPFRMSINGGTVLEDVWVGDLWVCAGQSNMELPLDRTEDWPGDALRLRDSPAIRQFRAPTQWSFDGPRDDIPGGVWTAADTDAIAAFTAAGFYFAREIYRKHGVPIGLLSLAIGGTPAESWISSESIKAFPRHLAEYRACADEESRSRALSENQKQINEWFADLAHRDPGFAVGDPGSPSWLSKGFGAESWSPFGVPGYWRESPIGNLTGSVWFRREFTVDAAHAGKSARLRLGCMVDSDITWINGVKVGDTGYQYPPRRYTIGEGILREGKNTIVIRMVAPHGSGGFVPGKPFQIEFPDAVIDLRGEWACRVGATSGPAPFYIFYQYKPAVLFDAFVAPLLRLPVSGVLWYQGESNTGDSSDYSDLMQRLIAEWRELWKRPELPFLYVQLPNYEDANPQAQDDAWAKVREMQRQLLAVPNTAMAVTCDVGEWNDLHPLDKVSVGHRLALAARRLVYGEKDLIHSGPLFSRAMADKGGLRLSFTSTGSGLSVSYRGRCPSPLLRGFELCSSSGQWLGADARIEGDTVFVSNESLPDPFAVRYAWANNPADANLINREGLPASPFEGSCG